MEKAGKQIQRPQTPTVVYFGVGMFAGAFVGFLLRPSVWLVGQLPFGTVITRGAYLQGLDQLLVSAAQTSFNYLLVGAVAGGALGFFAGALTKKNPKP